jgi:molybdopterin molybdotransferase
MACANNNLIPSNEALEYLLSQANTTIKTKEIAIGDALDKVLASDVKACINVPEFDNSAMDGYAINLDDNLKPPYKFEVVDRIIAGSIGKSLALNKASRIFTGAPTPENCNTVIPQEDCEVITENNKSFIEIYRPIELNENIRPQANDIVKGEIILNQGKVLNPADIALIASIGVAKITVFQPITVGVFFSGNEIIEPDQKLKAGQIYNSNKYSILTMLEQLGFNIINLGIIKDDFNATCDALSTLAKDCDVIITTGGVSVGEEDHLRSAVNTLGTINLWSVKMKPGKPLAYGVINAHNKVTHFVGLPGNPVSAIATFVLFIKPFIKKLQGITQYQNPQFKVQIDYDWKQQFRREFVRVKLDYSTIPPTATKYKKQGSDVLSSTSWADGLAEMDDEKAFKSGDIVNFYPLWS